MKISGTYVCKVCDKTVKPRERHEHSCPMEEDMCGQRGCNETGRCQA